MNIDRSSKWMAISGMCGLLFFYISNFANFFHGSNIVPATMQIAVNSFVFVSWFNGFKNKTGWKKLFASFGVFGPPIMATITFFHVILPFLKNLQL